MFPSISEAFSNQKSLKQISQYSQEQQPKQSLQNKGGNDQGADQQLNEDDPKGGGRRTRRVTVGRNFICGCGKTYLSYPALYTHIKTQHNGETPPGTRNSISCSSRRGRPRRNDDTNLINIHSGMPGANGMPGNSGFGLASDQGNDESLFKNMVAKEDLQCLEVLQTEYQGTSQPLLGFPVWRDCQTMKLESHRLYKLISKIENNNFKQDIGPNSRIDVVFAVFCQNITQFLNQQLYRMISIFIRAFMQFINLKGYECIINYNQLHKVVDSLYFQASQDDINKFVNNLVIYQSKIHTNEEQIEANKSSVIDQKEEEDEGDEDEDESEDGDMVAQERKGFIDLNDDYDDDQDEDNDYEYNSNIRQFSKDERCEYIPLLADQFILQFLPIYCPNYNQYFGMLLMIDLCEWLYKQRFTQIRIKMLDTNLTKEEPVELIQKIYEKNLTDEIKSQTK